MGVWLRLREMLDTESWQEVRYEDLVRDLPAVARRTLEFLKLPWEEAVLNYREHLAGKTVHSPTYLDVAKPLHGKPIGRWKNYARWLEPCLPGLERFVQELGYG
jgi:hypothetical protein